MYFLALNNTKKLIWRSDTIARALLNTSWVQLIDKRKFAKATLNENLETFVMHASAIKAIKELIHPFQTAQIAALLLDKASTKIPAKFSDYIENFSFDLAIELLENTRKNEHAIELIDEK